MKKIVTFVNLVVSNSFLSLFWWFTVAMNWIDSWAIDDRRKDGKKEQQWPVQWKTSGAPPCWLYENTTSDFYNVTWIFDVILKR